MGSFESSMRPEVIAFIREQHMFFVATAPLAADGHVNLSPKGLDTFRVLDDRTVSYLDFVGSGAETIAHVRENGRVTIMFCAFDGGPKIVRLYGRGEVIEPNDPRFHNAVAAFGPHDGVRSVIMLHVERVGTSCGFGVPLFRYVGERTELGEWCQRKGPDAVREYQRKKNATSLDGLPALRWVSDGGSQTGGRRGG